MARHLWLVGMMGSGKSTVGRLAAERLERDFIDSDDVVAARLGRSIAEYWEEHGEEAFRGEESSAVSELAAGPDRVVATGGGAVLSGANVELMRGSGLVIWLQASVATLAARVASNSNRRPLLSGDDSAKRLAEVLAQRADAYRAAAHATIATDGLDLETIVTRVEELWNEY